MKDLPHHMKKLNRRMIRGAHREELMSTRDDLHLDTTLTPERSHKQLRKQEKARIAKARHDRIPRSQTLEENRI